MTNFEKYKNEEVLESINFGSVDGKPIKCNHIECDNCDFCFISNCNKARMDWLKKEYVEIKIKLPKDLEIDAKIEVSDKGKVWRPRHFAGFAGENVIKAWNNGTTSWTSGGETTRWEYARLPKEKQND